MEDENTIKNDTEKTDDTQIQVIESHMSSEYEQSAIAISTEAISQHQSLKDIAQSIKLNYDKKYPGSGKATEGVYHCVTGHNFACAISHEFKQYIRMKVNDINVILWKSKDSPFHVHDN